MTPVQQKAGPITLTTLVIFIVVLSVGLFVRLWLAASFYGNFDQESWEIAARLMQRGANIYAETNRYNYSPVWAHILFAIQWLALWANLPFYFCVRGFLTLTDLGTACLIAALAARSRGLTATTAFGIYWLNPVSIMIVGYHGQFEGLAFLPLLAAMLIAVRAGDTPRFLPVWALGTLALLVKHITAFSLWMLFYFIVRSRTRAALLVSASAAVFLASFLPYLPAATDAIVGNVLTYGGIVLPYGVATVLPRWVSRPVLVVVMGLLPWLAKEKLRLDLLAGMLLSALMLLAFADGIGQQYFLIPVILGSAAPSLGLVLYSIVATVFLLSSCLNVHVLPFQPPLNVVWAAILTWFVLSFVMARAKGSTDSAKLRQGGQGDKRGETRDASTRLL